MLSWHGSVRQAARVVWFGPRRSQPEVVPGSPRHAPRRRAVSELDDAERQAGARTGSGPYSAARARCSARSIPACRWKHVRC